VRFRGIGRLSTERCTDLAAARIDRSVGLEDLELFPGGLNPIPAKEFPHGPWHSRGLAGHGLWGRFEGWREPIFVLPKIWP
jgi:hypothetical protein